MNTCCICGKTFDNWGNNPWPLGTDENDRCCDDCNMERVIPERIKMLYLRLRKAEEIEGIGE